MTRRCPRSSSSRFPNPMRANRRRPLRPFPMPKIVEFPAAWRGTEEYLLWWTKAGRLPPLATRASGSPPTLGQPGTRDLFGSTIDLEERSGGRFVLGTSFNDSRTTGLEFGYWFLGSRTSGLLAGGTTDPNGPIIGRPIVDASTGQETFVPIAAPGFQRGLLQVSWTDRAQGIEVNAVTDIAAGDQWQIDGIAGYRFIDLHEGLNMTQYGGIVGPLALPSLTALTSRRFRLRRSLSRRADRLARRHPERTALPRTDRQGGVRRHDRSRADQRHHRRRDSGPTANRPAGRTIGTRFEQRALTRSVFAVVPEAIARAGWSCGDHARFFRRLQLSFLERCRPPRRSDRPDDQSEPCALHDGNHPAEHRRSARTSRPAVEHLDAGHFDRLRGAMVKICRFDATAGVADRCRLGPNSIST